MMKANREIMLMLASRAGSSSSEPAIVVGIPIADPECQPRGQEQAEHRQHQDEADQTVSEEEVEAVLVLRGIVAHDVNAGAFGEILVHLFNVGVDGPGDVEGFLVAGGEDADEDPAAAVEQILRGAIFKAVPDAGDVAQANVCAHVARDDGDVGVFAGEVASFARAEENLARARAHTAGRHVAGRFANDGGRFTQRHAQRAQLGLGNFDVNLRVTLHPHFDLAEFRHLDEIGAHLLGQLDNLPFVVRTVDHHPEHTVLFKFERNGGPFHVVGE
jgi:hypothetical protein